MHRSVVFFSIWFLSTSASGNAQTGPPGELSKKAWTIAESILDHHVDPPARQQLFLAGIQGAYQLACVPEPPGVSRRISTISSHEQLAQALAAIWPKPKDAGSSETEVEEAFIDGMLRAVPGGAHFVVPQDLRVEEQTAGNRYIGVHIAVDLDQDSKCVRVQQVMKGGPADLAGLERGDLFEAIDGVDVKGKSIREVIDRLRGHEGTEVIAKVRKAGGKDLIEHRMTRKPLFRPTITGVKQESSRWSFCVEGSESIGYLRIREILASTPRELREAAMDLRESGTKAIVLDLRDATGEDIHSAVLFADNLLESGMIGKVRTPALDPSSPTGMVEKEAVYRAEPDALFIGLPIILIVNESTQGTAEWVSAALQDNRRAKIVGCPTRGSYAATSLVVLDKGFGGLKLATSRLERAEGRPTSPKAEKSMSLFNRVAPRDHSRLAKGENIVVPDYPINVGEPRYQMAVAAGPIPGYAPQPPINSGEPRDGAGVGQSTRHRPDPGDSPDFEKDQALVKSLEAIRKEPKYKQ